MRNREESGDGIGDEKREREGWQTVKVANNEDVEGRDDRKERM